MRRCFPRQAGVLVFDNRNFGDSEVRPAARLTRYCRFAIPVMPSRMRNPSPRWTPPKSASGGRAIVLATCFRWERSTVERGVLWRRCPTLVAPSNVVSPSARTYYLASSLRSKMTGADATMASRLQC